jgi:hypothetical protein
VHDGVAAWNTNRQRGTSEFLARLLTSALGGQRVRRFSV